jgi:lysophospholipase L1-like esterase
MKNHLQRTILALFSLFLISEFTVQIEAADSTSRFAIPASDDGLPGSGPIRRYDWFQKLWLNKRTGWATDVEKDQGAVVFLGDSITQGWGDDMGGSFPGMKVANRGISGDTTRGVLIRLAEDVLSLNPRAVVLLIGTNDLEEGADPDTIAANVSLILKKLKEHNASIPVIVCKVFPSSESKKRSAADIKKINQLYQGITSHDANIMLLETWMPFANAEGDATLPEFPDLLHPNKIGYAKWAAMLRPVLEDLKLLPVDKDEFTVEPGFEALFNGADLTGWEYRPSTAADLNSASGWQRGNLSAPPWVIVTRGSQFDGVMQAPDGRYVARNGRLVVTIPPEGRKIQQIYTQRDFPNDFVLKLEFRATPNADSGVFLRGKQLQCRDYLLAGPYKELKNYKPLDWNEMVVTVKGNTAHCTVNGEVIEEAFELPDTGPIGLEGDQGQLEYRNIRIKETK